MIVHRNSINTKAPTVRLDGHTVQAYQLSVELRIGSVQAIDGFPRTL